jgi:hypothetical protein
MAQPCFNYRLKTNERYMSEMQRERPLRPSDEELICNCFKREYHTPICDWLLIQTDSKREKLYNFLKGKPAKRPGLQTTGRPPSLNWNPHRSVDLIAETPRTKIDMNRSLYGPPPWQLPPQALVPSQIKQQGIFGFPEPYAEREIDESCPEKYTVFVLSILLKPHLVRDLARLADDYFPLMDEVLKWTEKKTMAYPIDPCQDIPTLRPKTSCRILMERLQEDHFYEPGHRQVRRTKVARDIMPSIGPGGSRGPARSAMSTRHRDTLCDDVHEDYLRSGPPPVTPMLRPVSNARPFAHFPEILGQPLAGLPELLQQSTANRATGQFNKKVVTGPTCL